MLARLLFYCARVLHPRPGVAVDSEMCCESWAGSFGVVCLPFITEVASLCSVRHISPPRCLAVEVVG